MTHSLLSVLPEELAAEHPSLTLQEARRILSRVHRTGDLPAVTPSGIRRKGFLEVRSRWSVSHLSVIERAPSRIDPFVKYVFRLDDGGVIESVRIPLEKPGRFVVCVSSQAGCALGCAFCATGRLGLHRNLHAWEIIDQVRHVRDDLPEGGRVHGVVFQGMGDPLANVDEVIRAVRVMAAPSLLAIDGRGVTVSSAGLLAPLPKLLRKVPRARIGISIGSAISQRRASLMPVERANPLRDVLRLVAAHAQDTHIAPMLSYTLLRDVNDTSEDVSAMSDLLTWFKAEAGLAPRVSVIRYNPIGGKDPFAPSTPARTDEIRRTWGALGIPVVKRYSGGSDVGAACGQLGMKHAPPSGARGQP